MALVSGMGGGGQNVRLATYRADSHAIPSPFAQYSDLIPTSFRSPFASLKAVPSFPMNFIGAQNNGAGKGPRRGCRKRGFHAGRDKMCTWPTGCSAAFVLQRCGFSRQIPRLTAGSLRAGNGKAAGPGSGPCGTSPSRFALGEAHRTKGVRGYRVPCLPAHSCRPGSFAPNVRTSPTSWRSWTPTLLKMFERWNLTVLSLMLRMVPISLLESLRWTSSTIFDSRFVRRWPPLNPRWENREE